MPNLCKKLKANWREGYSDRGISQQALGINQIWLNDRKILNPPPGRCPACPLTALTYMADRRPACPTGNS